MPSIINSDDGVVSGTSGLKTTGGNDAVTTFQQNGTESMRIDSSGNVGIGTTTPSSFDAKLALFNGNLALTTTTNKLYLYYASATNFAHVSTAADGSITFTNGTTSPTERMRITSAGGVSFGSSGTAYGTTGQVLVSQGNAPPVWSSTGTPTTQTYDTGTAATWTKPSTANWVLIELWGGGGSGGRGVSTNHGGGGGGGAYNSLLVKFSDLQGTVTYTVGAGGTGRTTTGVGNAGGNSSVTMNSLGGIKNSTIYAYGGGGGQQGAGSITGGGGGGIYSAGATSGAGDGGAPIGGVDGVARDSTYGGGLGGAGIAAGNSVYGGGGGGGGNPTGTAGGNSYYGGAGGGGGGSSAGAAGGTSVYGGDGSAGRTEPTASSNGSTPGGGSGGTENANSGNGGSGRVQFTYW